MQRIVDNGSSARVHALFMPHGPRRQAHCAALASGTIKPPRAGARVRRIRSERPAPSPVGWTLARRGGLRTLGFFVGRPWVSRPQPPVHGISLGRGAAAVGTRSACGRMAGALTRTKPWIPAAFAPRCCHNEKKPLKGAFQAAGRVENTPPHPRTHRCPFVCSE